MTLKRRINLVKIGHELGPHQIRKWHTALKMIRNVQLTKKIAHGSKKKRSYI